MVRTSEIWESSDGISRAGMADGGRMGVGLTCPVSSARKAGADIYARRGSRGEAVDLPRRQLAGGIGHVVVAPRSITAHDVGRGAPVNGGRQQ